MNTLSSSGQALSRNGGHAVGDTHPGRSWLPLSWARSLQRQHSPHEKPSSRERQTLEGQPASALAGVPRPTWPLPLRRALGTRASRLCTWRVGPWGICPPSVGSRVTRLGGLMPRLPRAIRSERCVGWGAGSSPGGAPERRRGPGETRAASPHSALGRVTSRESDHLLRSTPPTL